MTKPKSAKAWRKAADPADCGFPATPDELTAYHHAMLNNQMAVVQQRNRAVRALADVMMNGYHVERRDAERVAKELLAETWAEFIWQQGDE